MKKFISIAVLFLMNTQLFGWSGGFMGSTRNIKGNVTVTGSITSTGRITAGDGLVGDSVTAVIGLYIGNAGRSFSLATSGGKPSISISGGIFADTILAPVVVAASGGDSAIISPSVASLGKVVFDSARTAGTIEAKDALGGHMLFGAHYGGFYALDFGNSVYGTTHMFQDTATGVLKLNMPFNPYTGLTANGGFTATGKATFDSLGIGGGATITKIDTSVAGDSSEATFVNGNKILHFGTEVKP